MSVTIYAWTYGLKNPNKMILKKTNPGHSSIEITGTKKEIKKIYKAISLKDPKYLESYKNVQEFIDLYKMKFSNENDNLTFLKLRKDIIKNAVKIYLKNHKEGIKFANENGIKKSILDSALFMNDFKRKLLEKTPSTSIKLSNGEYLTSIYLSFFPNSYENLNMTKFGAKSNNIFNNFKNKKIYPGNEILGNSLNSYKEDCIEEEIGTDLNQIYRDIIPQNMEEISNLKTPRISSSNESLEKREKRFFKIKSGKLKGVLISQISYAQFSSYYKFFRNKKSIRYRHSLLNNNLKIDNTLIKSFLKEYEFENPFESIIKDLNHYKENLGIYIQEFNQNIAQHKVIINKINEKRDTIDNLIEELNEEFISTRRLYRDYLFVEGVPPSEIITFPSKICDNYGLDEVVILKNWIDKISICGYNFETTNCSWAVYNAFSPSAKEFKSPPFDFHIRPKTPLDIVSYAKKVQNSILKKPFIETQNKFQIPKKELFKSQEFKKLTENSFLQKLIFHKSANINEIYILLEKYDRIGDHQINIRIFLLEKILDEIKVWLDEKIELICKNKSHKFQFIKELINRVATEKEGIINYLLGINQFEKIKKQADSLLTSSYFFHA